MYETKEHLMKRLDEGRVTFEQLAGWYYDLKTENENKRMKIEVLETALKTMASDYCEMDYDFENEVGNYPEAVTESDIKETVDCYIEKAWEELNK